MGHHVRANETVFVINSVDTPRDSLCCHQIKVHFDDHPRLILIAVGELTDTDDGAKWSQPLPEKIRIYSCR